MSSPSSDGKSQALAERAAVIVAGACRAFLAHGYDGTSMDLVAAEAGVTKKTVYNHFPSKEALFDAVAASYCDEVASALDLERMPSEDVATGLEHFCRRLIEVLAVPPALEIYRLAIAQSRRFPDFGRSLTQLGIDRIESALAAYLERRTASGDLYIEEPLVAADHLIGNLMKLTHRALLGEEIRPDSAVIDRFVRQAVAMFCRAYAPHSLRGGKQ